MIYLLKHFETEDDYQGKRSYQENVPLNESGRRKGKKAREQYKDLSFDYCFSSPLIRDVESAMLLVGDKVIIDRDQRLIEMKQKECPTERLESFLTFLEELGLSKNYLLLSDMYLFDKLIVLLKEKHIKYQVL